MSLWTATRLTNIAGIVDIIGGAAYIWFETMPGVSIAWFGIRFIGLGLLALGIAGIGVGALVLAVGTMFVLRPARNRTWGKTVVVVSVVGFVPCLYGGLGIGIISGVLGGLLGYRSDPTPEQYDPFRHPGAPPPG